MPNWNLKRDLCGSQGWLMRDSCGPHNSLIVDNRSTDGPAEFVTERCPFVHLLALQHKAGYAGALNAAVGDALAHDATYVFPLNDDTVVKPEALTCLAKALRLDATIGCNRADGPKYSSFMELDYIAGCAKLIRTSFLCRVGLLDASCFIYYADSAFCRRVRDQNYRTACVADAAVFHSGSVSAKKGKALTRQVRACNRLRICRRLLDGPHPWSTCLVLVLVAAWRTEQDLATGRRHFACPDWRDLCEWWHAIPARDYEEHVHDVRLTSQASATPGSCSEDRERWMEHVGCNFYGANAGLPALALMDPTQRLAESFQFVRCPDCGLLYLHSWASRAEPALYCPQGHVPFAKAIDGRPSRKTRWARAYGVARRCRAVARRRATRRLLDVGFATGVSLSAMRGQGASEVESVESSPTAAEHALRWVGLLVLNGILAESGYPDTAFDVATRSDACKHVDGHSAHPHEVQRILRAGGWVGLKLLDPDLWEARGFGYGRVGYDTPRQLFAFPRSMLIYRRMGIVFDPVHTSIRGTNVSGPMRSPSSSLSARQKERANVLTESLTGSAARASAAPLLWLVLWLGDAPSLVYLACNGGVGGYRAY